MKKKIEFVVVLVGVVVLGAWLCHIFQREDEVIPVKRADEKVQKSTTEITNNEDEIFAE